MRFQLLDIVPHAPHPVTGEIISVHERLQRVIETAVLAERLGFDSYAVGERHAASSCRQPPPCCSARSRRPPSGSCSPPASRCSRCTIPSASPRTTPRSTSSRGGRLEIVIGKGNEDKHFPLFGLHIDHQYDYLTENYELLRRLLGEEDVAWRGTYRASLDGATTYPRPFDGPFRIWHGSATSTAAVDLAAKWGDPLFSANALQPRENYLVLIDRYREQLVAHGHDPAVGYVGAGSGGLFLADTDEEAVSQYRPIYEGFAARMRAQHAGDTRPGKVTSFATIEEAVAHGPALVGTRSGSQRRSSTTTRASATTCNRCRSSRCCPTNNSRKCSPGSPRRSSRWCAARCLRPRCGGRRILVVRKASPRSMDDPSGGPCPSTTRSSTSSAAPPSSGCAGSPKVCRRPCWSRSNT